MIGEIAALVASGIWAIASLLFEKVINKTKLSPTLISFYRGVISLPFFLISLQFVDSNFSLLTFWQWIALITSAILGIAIGDTAYFFSLQDIGIRKALLLQTLTPLFGVLFAYIFLKETMSNLAFIGIPITLIGIMWVITETTINQKSTNLSKGIIWGVISCITQGLGSMLLKWVLNNNDLSSLESSTIRLLIGTLILGIWLIFKQESSFSKIKKIKWKELSMASFLGTFVGLWLHQTAFKFTSVGIASTLLNTSPLFALGLTFYYKKQVTFRSFLGALIAIIGISFLFF